MSRLGKTLIAFATLALGACAEPWPMQYGWPGGDPYQPELAYCYVSIAKTDCFGAPIPGQEYRQVGRGIAAPH